MLFHGFLHGLSLPSISSSSRSLLDPSGSYLSLLFFPPVIQIPGRIPSASSGASSVPFRASSESPALSQINPGSHALLPVTQVPSGMCIASTKSITFALGSNRVCPLPPVSLRLLPASPGSLCTPSGTCPGPSGVTWLPPESSILIRSPSCFGSIVRQFAHPSELWCCENSRQENLRSSSGCSGLTSSSGDPGGLSFLFWLGI